jgi:type I restriction enzyme S subunit
MKMSSTTWPTLPIKNIYKGLYDGPHATPRPAVKGPIFLGIKNVTEDGQLDLVNVRHIAEDDFADWTRRVQPQENDLVFTYEATLNRYALIPDGFRGCLGRRMALIRPNLEVVDVKYLFYYFFTDEWRSVIRNNMLSGSTVDRIPLTGFPDFPVRIPPLPIQRRIAGILSAYDDLIENSQRRIKTLEDMARRLYREWFVYFRFPGHEDCRLVESPLGEIPEGWEVKLVEEIVKRIPVGKKYDQKTVASNGAVPVFDQGKTGIIGFHDDEPGVIASETAPVIVFANHTCYQRLIHIPFSAIQNVLPFVPSPVLSRNIYWLHWATNGLVVFNDYKGHWPEFAAKDLIVPPAAFCQRFGEFAAPLSQQILKLERQIHNLRRTRDLLLPRLLSGQIDVESLSDPAISHS